MADETTGLDYPSRDWTGFFRNHFGPSMLWALIGIGGSHIVLAPTLGGTFGLVAIWMFGLVYLVKYGGWELGIRYNYGIGGNPIEAYDQLPGPNDWALWLTFLIFTVAYTGLIAAVGTSTAAFFAAVTGIGSQASFVLLVGLAAGFVLSFDYSLVERTLLVFTASLAVLLLVGVVTGPPSGTVVAETLVGFPENRGPTSPLFVGLLASAAGFAPTGFSTSVLIGSWSMAKRQGARQLRERGLDPEDPAPHEYIAEWIRTGKRDFRIGYLFSFLLIAAMVVLASNVLFPDPPTDGNLALALGTILQESLGPWARWAMIVGAFAALYSTVITLIDGSTRAAARILPMALDDETAVDRRRFRRGLIVVQALVAIGLIAVLGLSPVTFIVWIAATLAVVEVFFYPANWYVVERNLPDRFRPSRRWQAYYAISLVFVLVFGGMGAATQLGVI